jgi:hypothetical protein
MSGGHVIFGMTYVMWVFRMFATRGKRGVIGRFIATFGAILDGSVVFFRDWVGVGGVRFRLGRVRDRVLYSLDKVFRW